MRDTRGITLIALVITIIVLLILAGISIVMLTGENGILTKAGEAKSKTEKAGTREKLQVEVLGSYGTDGKLNLSDLKTNITNHIPGATIEGETFPLTVTVDGQTFTVDEKGNVELAGAKPVVDESSVTISLEDESAIPEEGVKEGTKLKIHFTASIEGGTTTITPNVPYVTNGTEKEVTFTITGIVDGEKYEITKKVELKNYYKKTEFGAEDISKKPATFYGAEVRGYAVNQTANDAVKNAVTTWRIFYAGKEPNGTEDNIYLIADDYIPYTAAPDGKNGSKIYKNATNYRLSFNNVYQDYEQSNWILGQTEEGKNSLAKGWLNQYFNYTPDSATTYPNRTSTNTNIKAVGYMLDTKIWNSYAGEKAKYAIGGPPIEMYCTSYKESHPTSNINCEVSGTIGYSYSNASNLASDCNKIYIKPKTDKAPAMWLTAPSYTNTNDVLYVRYDGCLSYDPYSNHGPGLCPIVCLKSGIQLKKISESIYTIKP